MPDTDARLRKFIAEALEMAQAKMTHADKLLDEAAEYRAMAGDALRKLLTLPPVKVGIADGDRVTEVVL